MSRPVPTGTALLAGLLDQLFFLAVVLAGVGTALLVADSGDGSSGVAIGVGIGAAVVGALVLFLVQLRVAVRAGSTAGLFVIGLRFDPSRPVHWHDDAADWLLAYWPNLVLMPLARLVSRRDRSAENGIVPDPRTRTGGARVARLLLAAALVASPVPLLAGFAA